MLRRLARRLERLERPPGHVAQRHRLALDHDPAGGHPRDVEQVVDETGQVVGLASDDHPDPRGVVVLGSELFEHRDRVADRGQGISKLVGQHREELVLAAIALLDLAIEAPVVERDRRAARQIADEIDVGGGIAAVGFEHGARHRAERRAASRQGRHDRPRPAAVLRGQRLELVADDHAQSRVENLAVPLDAGGWRAEPALGVDAQPHTLGFGRSGGVGGDHAGEVGDVRQHRAKQVAGDRGALERPGQHARGLGQHAQPEVVGLRGGPGGLLRGERHPLFRVTACLGVHPRQLDEHPDLGAEDVWQERAEEIVDGAERVAAGSVQLVGVGGEKDDRHVASPRALADHRGGLEAVHLRHVDVEQDHRDVVVEEKAQRLPTGIDGDDILSELGQHGLDRHPLRGRVVDDQDVDAVARRREKRLRIGAGSFDRAHRPCMLTAVIVSGPATPGAWRRAPRDRPAWRDSPRPRPRCTSRDRPSWPWR